MPYLAHDGVRLHYDLHGDPGDRPPLLLSHGFRASGRMWDRNVAALARDREVLTWDLRGHVPVPHPTARAEAVAEQQRRPVARVAVKAVSYTHLTLPTILRV